MKSRMQFTPAIKTLSLAINEIKNINRGGLDLQPDYQREYIWKNDFKDKLIYSIVRGYPIGNISIAILMQPNSKNAKSEVVDGQQRLTTLYNFAKEEYEVKHEYSKKITEDIVDYLSDIVEGEDSNLDKLRKKIENGKKFKLSYKMLPSVIRDNFDNYNLSISNISESTKEQISEYFRFLQNQEILRAGEIIYSYPDTGFDKYLNSIKDLDKFLNIVGFSNDKRKDFNKTFYGIIGILDETVMFGSSDKSIKEYILKNDGNLSEDIIIKVNSFIDNINDLCQNMGDYRAVKKPTVRFIKLLLLLLAFNEFKFDNKSHVEAFEKLVHVESRLKSFSSVKANAVSQTFEFLQYDFKDESDKIIEEYRLIANFCRGTQSYEQVKSTIQLLHKIIDRELYSKL